MRRAQHARAKRHVRYIARSVDDSVRILAQIETNLIARHARDPSDITSDDFYVDAERLHRVQHLVRVLATHVVVHNQTQTDVRIVVGFRTSHQECARNHSRRRARLQLLERVVDDGLRALAVDTLF